MPRQRSNSSPAAPPPERVPASCSDPQRSGGQPGPPAREGPPSAGPREEGCSREPFSPSWSPHHRPGTELGWLMTGWARGPSGVLSVFDHESRRLEIPFSPLYILKFGASPDVRPGVVRVNKVSLSLSGSRTHTHTHTHETCVHRADPGQRSLIGSPRGTGDQWAGSFQFPDVLPVFAPPHYPFGRTGACPPRPAPPWSPAA